jgi:hypothetical protein
MLQYSTDDFYQENSCITNNNLQLVENFYEHKNEINYFLLQINSTYKTPDA